MCIFPALVCGVTLRRGTRQYQIVALSFAPIIDCHFSVSLFLWHENNDDYGHTYKNTSGDCNRQEIIKIFIKMIMVLNNDTHNDDNIHSNIVAVFIS